MNNLDGPITRTLIGFKCDEGVRRNRGRVGAFEGPDFIRKYLNFEKLNIIDLGNVVCEELDFTSAHKCLQAKVLAELEKGRFPIVLGGGHDMSFSNFAAAARYVLKGNPNAKIAAINIDPHFDLRDFDKGANSGTSFNEMAKFCENNKLEYLYYCLGVNKQSNADDLFTIANKLGVRYCFDDELVYATELINECISTSDYIYLTLDMDAFKSSLAPGVSAQAKVGWDVGTIESLITRIKKSNKLILADIAELNPRFDIDERTAKLAAHFTEFILS
jgi:formiminoglutamase